MNKKQAQRVLEELSRRNNRIELLDPNFKAQNDFIRDPARLKAAQCTRRAGKSYGCGLYLYEEARGEPYVDVLYIGLTRAACKRIMFDGCLAEINRAKNLGAKANGSELTYTLPNQSKIHLLGVDANPAEMNKLLGGKYKLVIIDESAFFRQSLKKLIYEVLKPAVADYNGTIAVISTTSDLTSSLYYDITNGKELGWSVHKWTAYDNPHMKIQWAREVKELTENNPEIIQTPMYKRMYLNEWYIDEDNLIYKFHLNKNTIDSLPDRRDWTYILGIDLGWNDPTAFTVCAFHKHDRTLYIVETQKQSKMTFTDVGDRITSLNEKYKFSVMVVDNASKQGVEEIKSRYQFPLIAAEKSGKRDYIELMNADFLTGKIKLLDPTTKKLQKEYSGLIWDERKKDEGKYVEHPSCPNHLCDATLYAWRWAYNYAWEQEPEVVAPQSEAAVDQFWDRESEKVQEQEFNDVPLWEQELEGEYDYGW